MTNKHPYKTVSRVHMRRGYRRIWSTNPSHRKVRVEQKPEWALQTPHSLQQHEDNTHSQRHAYPKDTSDCVFVYTAPALMKNFALCLESCFFGWAGHPEYTPSIPTAWLCPVQTLLYLKPPCCCPTQKQSNACSGAAEAHSQWRGFPNNLWRTVTPPK